MIKKILFSVFLGIVATIFFAQYDQRTYKKIGTWAQNRARTSLDCCASFTIQSLNFFSPSFVLTDFATQSLTDGVWSWNCKRCTVSGSWLQFFLKGVMEVHVVMEGLDCSSTLIDNTLAIESYFAACMRKALMPFPVVIQSFICKNASINVYEANSTRASLSFNSSSFAVGSQIKTMMSLYDGAIMYDDTVYARDLRADISLMMSWADVGLSYLLSGSGVGTLPHLEKEGICYIKGFLDSGHGRVTVRNAYNSLVIDPIIITKQDIRISATLPLAYCLACIKKTDQVKNSTGSVQCFVRIAKDGSQSVDGHVIIQDGMVNNYCLCDVTKIMFNRRGHEWKYNVSVVRRGQECKGVGHWNEVIKQGVCSLTNSTPISLQKLSYWAVMPHNVVCRFWFNEADLIGTYKIHAENRLSKAEHCLQGVLVYDNNNCSLNGFFDETEYTIDATFKPCFVLNRCLYLDKERKTCIALNQEKNDIVGNVSIDFMRDFIKSFFHYDLQGEGMCAIRAHRFDETIHADIKLIDTTIRLPETYNFIDKCTAHIAANYAQRTCIFDDIAISLYTGTIDCARATLMFDEQGNTIFAHAPVVLNHCLLNIKKDLFATVSGALLFSQKYNEKPSIKGALIIDRAQLKENIFSAVIQKRLFDYTHAAFSLPHTPVDYDVTIETQSPIKIDTAFLQTNAKVDLRVHQNSSDPIVSGTVILNAGSLIFPYKSLLLTKGILTFLPDRLFDPTIELIARNKIKKYDISLQVAGSLSNHHIMLDATPPLSEEQIMALLLVGSEQSSLNSMIPAIIVQNLKQLIFVNNQSKFLEKYFSPLLRPFSISLTPSFADQTGRGGLRGILEIGISDRWKATIQKNFTLTEDTRLELECLLTDDITLRGIRDERRDMGGEIEMKWKF